MNEHGSVLMLRGRTRVRLPESAPGEDAETFTEAAVTLTRTLGVGEPWMLPGCEGPIFLDPGRADPEDGLRPKVVFRYLFRAHSGLCAFASGAPQVWVPLSEIDRRVAARVSSFTGQRVA